MTLEKESAHWDPFDGVYDVKNNYVFRMIYTKIDANWLRFPSMFIHVDTCDVSIPFDSANLTDKENI